MLILGIDPGMATTGYGLIKQNKKGDGLLYVACGVIKTPVGMEMGKRLKLLRRDLKKIIKSYSPDCSVLEQLFFGRNAKTAMTVSQARGVIMLTMAESNLPLFEYQGLTVKKTLTQNGRAKKRQIQKTVRKILKMRYLPRPDDAADALGMAIYHALKQ